jgi:hypothetical protein
MRLHSLVTQQGTAIPESTLCDSHGFSEGYRIVNSAPADADLSRGFVETTANPEVACVVCGATGGTTSPRIMFASDAWESFHSVILMLAERGFVVTLTTEGGETITGELLPLTDDDYVDVRLWDETPTDETRRVLLNGHESGYGVVSLLIS